MTLLECAAFMEACRKAEFAEVRDEATLRAMAGKSIWEDAAIKAMAGAPAKPAQGERYTVPLPREWVDRALAEGIATADDSGGIWIFGLQVEVIK
jgi:hypothetical protein